MTYLFGFFFFSKVIKEAGSDNGFVVGLGWWSGIKGKRNKQGRKTKIERDKKKDQRRRGVLYEESFFFFFLRNQGRREVWYEEREKKGKVSN